jgi:tRNA threonylcarbamoyl adenosine modification protein (Sua5/YciO/YrdC/YwlC family)
MLLKMHPDNPSKRQLERLAGILSEGGLIIYPTDTVYAVGCDMYNQKAIDRVCQLVGKKPEEASLALICYDLSNIAEYTTPFGNHIFKLMRGHLPGPYTFILQTNNKVPRLFKNKKKEIGIRVPDNPIPREIVRYFGNPIVTTSLHHRDNGFEDYLTDAEEIHERFGKLVEAVVDGGPGGKDGSTVIDCTGEAPTVIREGKGAERIIGS